MSDYLRQDLVTANGYIPAMGRPRPTEAAVALTEDGRCVFGDPQVAKAARNSFYGRKGSKLMYYDDEVERQRRLLCDTVLAQLVLDNPGYAQPGVDNVSHGIRDYWTNLKRNASFGEAQFEGYVKNEGKYISNPTSFGRLPKIVPAADVATPFAATIDQWVGTLAGGDLPKVLTIHDTFLKIRCAIDNKGSNLELASTFKFRQDWYDKVERGRVDSKAFAASKDKKNPKPFVGSDLPGLITTDFTIPYYQALERCQVDLLDTRREMRNRGTDMFVIDGTKMKPEFRDLFSQYNLIFAASASGTTSTLLASAKEFWPGFGTDPQGGLQYLLGCVAYLVGGGMHTCHEVFYTGDLAQLATHVPGKYLNMLPAGFKASRDCGRWSDEFWDLVREDRASPR
jgi:hypothetical protein